jgi:hypothetical protein
LFLFCYVIYCFIGKLYKLKLSLSANLFKLVSSELHKGINWVCDQSMLKTISPAAREGECQ